MMLYESNKVYISIIMPVYNSERYIEKTIKSVIAQDFYEYELIIVDDGSTDNGIEIARKVLQETDVKFSIINQENMGLSGARNTGIRASVGNYLCFVDSDDIIGNSHLSSMYNVAIRNNSDFVCCQFETVYIDNRYGSPDKEEKAVLINADQFADAVIKRNPQIFVCGLLLKKEFFESERLYFNERLRFGEDADFLLRLLYRSNDIALTNRASYKYLDRNGSMMKKITRELGDIFVDEISKTFYSIIDKVENKEKIRIVYNRVMLGFLHAFAMCSNYKDFREIGKRIDRKEIYREVYKLDDIKVRIFSLLLRISPQCAFLGTKVYRH